MSSSAEDRPLRPVPRNRYQDFQVAGEGAMGLVYLALDTELKRSVAFKIVRPAADADDAGSGATPVTPLDVSAPAEEATLDTRFADLKARFLQEAWVTGGMEHPGIVPVYELGQTEGGVPYYTMRFVRGRRTLMTAIEDLVGRPFEERLSLLEPFLKLCDAVAYAHAKGVIHRDLKPANIALGEYGEVVVLDWGLARLNKQAVDIGARVAAAREALGFKTASGGIGTLGYVAPEVVHDADDNLDERGDVYSLGVVLFEILTGLLPFPVEPFPEYLENVRSEDPPSARTLSAAVPEALDRLCAQALSRERGSRLSSVRALADGVRQWQTQSSLDRELRRLLRDAQTALAAAADSRGPSRIRQTQRALEALAAARRQRPDSARVQSLQSEARALRDRGIRETQRLSRRRIVLWGGAALLVLVSIAAFVVAGLLNERRVEAEEANRATGVALAEATKQREAAQRESEAAREAREEAEREAEEARNAYELVSSLVDGLQDTDQEGASRLAEMLDAGVDDALARKDAAGILFLFEQARDALPHGRLALGAALRRVPVPPELVEAERVARSRTGEAQRAFLAARVGGQLQETRRKKRLLQAAQAEHDRTLETIASARQERIGVSLPGAATVKRVQAALRPDDVFVCYGRVRDVAVAVVVRRDTKWIVPLGDERHVHEAVAGLRAEIAEQRGVSLLLETLRQLFVDPLALPPPRGRVIVAPHGATLLVPFSLLLPERKVWTVPSAGAWLHLTELTPVRGEGILAVADAIPRRRAEIPGARAEAESVGTTTLLGEDATWAKLAAALGSKEYWRSVHLTCAGRITGDADKDAFLELTPEDADDGVLSARDVAWLDCRASLLVLSTASTRLEPGGLDAPTLDLPQACLFAGARRVLFPSFFTDGDSTRALMEKFYELWDPKDGSEALGAAAALEQAQAYVRDHPDHPEWQHPFYWGAWILWGDAD